MKYQLEVEEVKGAGHIRWHRYYDSLVEGIIACSDQVHRFVAGVCKENNLSEEAEIEYRDECAQIKDTEKSVFFMADSRGKYYVRLRREE